MPERSWITDVVASIVEGHTEDLKVKRPAAIPFGMERTKSRSAREEMESMTPEERRILVKRMGMEKVRGLVKGMR